MWFISPTQVNAWVPWELTGYPSAQMKINYYGLLSNVVTVPLNTYVPAFLINSGTVADARDNNTGALITTSNPAVAGEELQLYCNGLGPVTNQPASGTAALGSPNLAQIPASTPVTVSIGDKNARVDFAGLTPGFVGLYLVDVSVPAGLTSGNQIITVSVGGKTSPTSVAGSNIVLPIK
jgi:uncharacterized protein (TIGR03437 family)